MQKKTFPLVSPGLRSVQAVITAAITRACSLAALGLYVCCRCLCPWLPSQAFPSRSPRHQELQHRDKSLQCRGVSASFSPRNSKKEARGPEGLYFKDHGSGFFVQTAFLNYWKSAVITGYFKILQGELLGPSVFPLPSRPHGFSVIRHAEGWLL